MENDALTMKQKKGLNLMVKILGIAIVPLILLVVLTAIDIRDVGIEVSEQLVQHELNATTYAVQSTLSTVSDGDFRCEDGLLYKGDMNLSEDQTFLDSFRENTNVDVTIFYGDTRMATSIKDESGNRVIGTTIDGSVYDKIATDGSYFTSNIEVQGIPYFGYYEVIGESDGKKIILFTGME